MSSLRDLEEYPSCPEVGTRTILKEFDLSHLLKNSRVLIPQLPLLRIVLLLHIPDLALANKDLPIIKV